MMSLREIEERVLANGRVEGHELELLRQVMYGDGKVNREKADFLVELHKRVQHRTPAFQRFFYQAIKDHILVDGCIGAKETDWLRQMVFANDKVDDEERKFLQELNGEAKQVAPEFEKLFKQCIKQPPEQRTSGG
jgi:hypothetical protein